MEHKDDSLYHIFLKVTRLHYLRAHMLFEKDGIHPGQFPLLMLLNRCEGQSQKELAEKLRIAPATLTVMIKRMEKHGFVEKRQDTEDQRVSRIFLTEKGKAAHLKADESMKILDSECFNHLTVEEKLIFRRLFMQMLDNLKKTIKDNNN